MYIPESVSGSREILPGHAFHLTFPLLRPGRITVLASAHRRSLSLDTPAHYRVELFHPAQEMPVEIREIEGTGLLTIIEIDVDPADHGACGNWFAQITNTNSHPLGVTLEATYPGSVEIHQRSFPLHFLEAIASSQFTGLAVHLHRGRNASSVTLPPALGLRPFHFSVSDLDTRVAAPLLPEVRIQQSINEIDSNAIQMRIVPGSRANPGGTLRLELEFEETGAEWFGSFPIHLSRLRLLIELDLGVSQSRFSYNNVRTDFQFDIDIKGLPDWMLNPLFHYRDRVQEDVRNGVRAAFEDIDAREALTVAFERGMETVLGQGTRKTTVQVENGQLRLGIFRPGQALAQGAA